MAKLSYEYVKNEIEKEGYKLLEEEYKGCNVKMSILCPNNHTFSTRWRNWQQGVRCPHCKGVAKLNIDIIRQAFKEEGYELLTNEYVNNQGFNLVDEYIDDGYSGTTFDRPGFERMITDIQKKKNLRSQPEVFFLVRKMGLEPTRLQ